MGYAYGAADPPPHFGGTIRGANDTLQYLLVKTDSPVRAHRMLRINSHILMSSPSRLGQRPIQQFCERVTHRFIHLNHILTLDLCVLGVGNAGLV